jgi:hypothetical protein
MRQACLSTPILQKPHHEVDRHQTLDMCSRAKQAHNKKNKHTRHKDLLLEFNLTLEVYVSVEVPTKGGPLHLGRFPPSSDHKDQARVTYSKLG